MTSDTNSVARKVRSGVSHTLLVIVAIVFLGPLAYAVSTSLKPADEVFTPTPHLFGSKIRWQNYADAFTFAPFDRYFLNSLFVAIAGTLVVVVASSMSAYAFARLRFMLPLARPAIAVLTVFTFISFWGSFLWPLIIINSVEDKGTVPLGLAQFVGQQGTQWNLMMAASMLAMLPTVLLVVLLQKHL